MNEGRRSRARRRALRSAPAETQPAAEPAADLATEPAAELATEPEPTETPSIAGTQVQPEVPAQAAGRAQRTARIVIAAIAIVVLVAVIGYAAAGYAFASSRIDSAKSTYNAVVAHQNAITEEFNSINSKITAVHVTTTPVADYQQNKAAFVQLVSQSQAAQPTISADDASLAAAQASLKERQWLTIFNRSSLDQVSAKIGHERGALASAKTITVDMVQLGTFFQSYDDSFIDLNTVSTKEMASDFAGAATAIKTLKADVAKAIELSTAPGLPPEMKQLLTDLQSLAVDEGRLADAAVAGDASAAEAALKAFGADLAKVEAYDYDKISTEIKSYYQPLIDKFNSEVSLANSM